MGTIGGLINSEDRSQAGPLRAALAASERGRNAETVTRGRVVLGAASGGLDDAAVGVGTQWSVAVCGVIDSVGDQSRPTDPAREIALAFDKWGIEASSHITGDFTCIASDGRRMIAFRDHVGTDGLFMGDAGSVVCVMSEPKQVVAALGRRREPDIDALVSLYFSQWEAEDDAPCVVKGVKRVPRGFIVEITEDGWRRSGRLWDPSDVVETSRLTVVEAQERAWNLLGAAVARSIDGPTAVSLSGGIDSTLIAAALADHRDERVGAVSAVYPESPSVDESRFISETVSKLELPAMTYQPARPRLSDIEVWVDRCDGPTYGLAIGAIEDLNEAARSAGYRTLLSGEMGELVYDLREHAIGRMLLRGRLGTAARNITQLRKRGVPLTSLGRIVGATMTPTRLALAYTGRKPATPPSDWLDPDHMPGLGRRWDLERSPSRRWPDIQLFFAIGPSYPGLEASTIVGDYGGVRTRRPLVDRELWEFFLSLPPEVKFPDAWTKSLMRRALAGRAPDSVVWRTDKTVFDEDSKRNAEYPELIQIISDGFELPGIRYKVLLERLEEGDMTSLQLAMVRHLASIHTWVAVA